MRTLVVGDMHGAHKALLQCMERSGFDRDKDRLISLGDVCDGYPQVHLCIEELLSINHCDLVIGNHDLWVLGWALSGDASEGWLEQGGEGSLQSYGGGPVPDHHIDFLKNGQKYLRIGKKLFVHGGFDPEKPIENQGLEVFAWDRTLVERARRRDAAGSSDPISPYEEIYVGHTPTIFYGVYQPIRLANVWMMDTGAGWTGRLTFMDIDTKDIWQSDPVQELYPGVRARGR